MTLLFVIFSSKSPKTVLKQPLQDSSEITLNFEPDTLDLSQPALQTSEPAGSTIFEPTTAGPSATAKSDVAMKDGEKHGTEIAMDIVDPMAKELCNEQ